MYKHDERVVMTLDAGGTNFVFSAIKGCVPVVEPVCLLAIPDDLEKCLSVLLAGFSKVKDMLTEEPVAISFAFPGPADYENGVLGNLHNFPVFNGGVALGPYLEEKLGIPTFINNDGNLFAYGEALAGALPEINGMLEQAGNVKHYKNLIGITLGTGFGCGIVINKELLVGDNSCGGDLFGFRNCFFDDMIIEESVSIRAVQRVYKELSKDNRDLTPKAIFDIAERKIEGDSEAAAESFASLGIAVANALTYALFLIDGVVVIGGGLSGAAKYIMPSLMATFKKRLHSFSGLSFPMVQMETYYLDEKADLESFLKREYETVIVPDSKREVTYFSKKKTGIILSHIGASQAISLGAYAFALHKLDGASCF